MNPPQSDDDGEAFQDVVTNVLMMTEELRRHLMMTADVVVTIDSCLQWRHEMEGIMEHLHNPILQQPSSDDVHVDLKRHVHQRAKDIANMVLERVVTKPETTPEDEASTNHHSTSPPPTPVDPAVAADMERDCQGSIARIAEINLILTTTSDATTTNSSTISPSTQHVIDTYVSYQRQVLRQRAKPSIAQLVAQRKNLQQQQQATGRHRHLQHHSVDEEDEDEENEESKSRSQHAQVITVILGQASALIHPLLEWRFHLPPPPKVTTIGTIVQQPEHPTCQALRALCNQSVEVLDGQAQSLTKTVAMWFLEDRHVDEWMNRQSAASTDDDLGTTAKQDPINLNELDELVEEMAFTCQVLARYVTLIASSSPSSSDGGKTTTSTKSPTALFTHELQPELNWKYASLERFLVVQQWQAALELASPVHIILGTSIQVPSVVEDAQYLSTRALERAASTRSTQAIGTVAHAIANDVWSTDIAGGIHQALLDQTGCWLEVRGGGDDGDGAKKRQNGGSGGNTKNNAPLSSGTDTKSGNSFASALLGALDDDTGKSPPRKNASRPPTAPSSGNFLTSLASFGVLGGDKLPTLRLETALCALNGIHSAEAACSSLVHSLDSLLPNGSDGIGEGVEPMILPHDSHNAVTMIQLAREELFRFASAYKELLHQQVCSLVVDWCGTVHDEAVYKGPKCIPVMRYYLDRASYFIANSAGLAVAEDDARLANNLIQPLKDSPLLQQLEKCDADVLTAICEHVASVLVDLVLDCLQSTVLPKRFNDWGSLLLSKQVRLLQHFMSGLLVQALQGQEHHGAIPILSSWERLNQVATVLQLEKPSDWTSYYQPTSILSPYELQVFLRLRSDFSQEAIASVVASIRFSDASS
jgi:hypothetical protein